MSAQVSSGKPKKPSIYPRTCGDCGVVYKNASNYHKHLSTSCLITQTRNAIPEPAILLDEQSGESYVEFLIYKGRLAEAIIIGRGKL